MIRFLPLVLALTAPAFADGEGWVADYDEGVALAKKEGKNLLVDFTGSDWCGWCIRLNKEVFAHESWQAGVKDDYILVALDFPRDPEILAKVPNPARNQELSSTYGVGGFPTILLMTPDGDVFGRTGYQEGGPEAYLTHMAELKTKGMAELAEVSKIVGAFEAAGEDTKVEAWGRIVAHLEAKGPDAVGARRLIAGVKSALTFDADNKAGLKRKAVEKLMQLGRVDDDVFAAAKSLDAKNADGLYEGALVAKLQGVNDEASVKSAMALIADYAALGVHKSDDDAFMIYLLGAWWSDKVLGEHEGGVAYANKALALGVGEPGMIQALNDILNHTHEEGDHEHGEGEGGEHGGDDGKGGGGDGGR